MKIQNPNNIILIGMPGSGKSTVGVLLAKELLRSFIDTDLLIQTGEGSTLQKIIDKKGMESFLEIEARYVQNLSVNEAVIASGGSVVLVDKTMQHLKKYGLVIFLDTYAELLIPRIDIYSRGIVKTPGKSLDDVYHQRYPLYKHYADICIECKTMNQHEITHTIRDILDKQPSEHFHQKKIT